MVKSRTQKAKESVVASWLVDAFGAEDEELGDYKQDARDLMNFLRANGWEVRPAVLSFSKGEPF